MIERDTDACVIIRMMVREQGKRGQIPVMGLDTLRVAKEVLGIMPMQHKDKSRYWMIPADWSRRLREAGIDPDTLELVDLDKWLLTRRAIDQRREFRIQEKARAEIHAGIRESTAKYRPPPAPRPSELIAQHVLTGKIVKHLRNTSDNT